ncbi:ABC transporter substrate-binding protein [Marinomonas sp. S3726]|uniref:ABC transporter substrate-binding protein n=1 Tax=Marinomonas sp. S3726 TaxID=579484 RepID=UPI0005FA0C45|nr:ABC transporter substrate-binding protein [Marinomonas sp. S3726]KJZ10799.1 ABC transporter substrate-binding protein [Marinomonas sp. S3726]
MHYWKALAFLRSRLALNQVTQLSLDELTQALGCTRRNAQLIIKKLEKEGWIEWQAGIGRGNLPRIKLIKPLHKVLQDQADVLISENKLDQALLLIEADQRDAFLVSYIERYQSKDQGEKNDQDILQIPFYRGTHCLDPIYVARRTESHISRYLYSNLLRFDPRKNTFEGDLAVDWKRDENTWFFTLRKGLKFHDASSLEAKDIKTHFDRLKVADHQNSRLFSCIKEVEVLDPLRLAFHLQSLSAHLPALLTDTPAGITKEIKNDDKTDIIGSGSFVLTEQSNWLTRLTAFEHYHGFRPWMDGIEIWNIGDKAKDFKLHCDLVHPHPLAEIAVNQRPEFEQKVQWEKGCEYVLINANNNRFLAFKENRLLLQALLKALGVPENILEDKGELVSFATGMLSIPQAPPYSLPKMEKETAKQVAKKLLEKINRKHDPREGSDREIANQDDNRLQILTYQLPQHITMAQYYCEQLNSLGLACDYRVEEFPVFSRNETQRKADIIISGEVFSQELMDVSWVGWFKGCSALEECFNSAQRAWRDHQLEQVFQQENEMVRSTLFEKMEAELVDKGVYLPLFHVQQQLNQADTLNPMELLANGWIDFNTVTFKA